MTHSASDVRALLERHGLAARRDLGQNFVVDPNTVRKIAALSGVGEGTPVVEIGPGLGSLTLALLELGADVTAVEMDSKLAEVLREVVAGRGVRIIEGDARAVAWPDILADYDRWNLVANLPYNVATPMILDLLRDVPQISTMLVMVQREVAERLAATAGESAIGIPSVLVSYHGVAKIVGRVPATVFHPQPRVESALVQITRHSEPPTALPLAAIDPLIRAAYGQRRKMLRKSLAALVAADQFESAGVDPQARPETLDIRSWARLAAAASEDQLDRNLP